MSVCAENLDMETERGRVRDRHAFRLKRAFSRPDMMGDVCEAGLRMG